MEVFEFKRIETALGNVLRNMRDITLAYAACSDKAAAVRKSSDYTDQAKEKKESPLAAKTVKELKAYAEEKGIALDSRAKKADIIATIEAAERK